MISMFKVNKKLKTSMLDLNLSYFVRTILQEHRSSKRSIKGQPQLIAQGEFKNIKLHRVFSIFIRNI